MSIVDPRTGRRWSPSTEPYVLDHANGVKVQGTVNTNLIIPPANCQALQVASDVDIVLRTDGTDAADDGKSLVVWAKTSVKVPCIAGKQVKFMSITGGAANVRCVPFADRVPLVPITAAPVLGGNGSLQGDLSADDIQVPVLN